jgi:hypothetical protein
MLKSVGVLTWSFYAFLLAYQIIAPEMSTQTSSQTPPINFNMVFLSRFMS